MPNQPENFAQSIVSQPLPSGSRHPSVHQNNIRRYPEMPKTELMDTEQTVCAICREMFLEGNAIARMNKCNHIFHENCILTYLGVPDIYLDSSEPPHMYPCCIAKAVRECGPYTNMYLKLYSSMFCFCCYYCFSFTLHPRRVELSDSDIRLLHSPDNPRFLSDHLDNLTFFREGCLSDQHGEWFGHQLPQCPLCRAPFEVQGSYTLYQVTD